MSNQEIFYLAFLAGFAKRVRALNYDSDAAYDADALDNAARVMNAMRRENERLLKELHICHEIAECELGNCNANGSDCPMNPAIDGDSK